jgi:hypothetical protein
MSREQRRLDRKNAARSGTPTVSRRTPVKAPGAGGPPWMPLAIVAGVIAIVALIGYLIFQSVSDDGQGLSAAEKAEQDSSTSLPGQFVPSQGRGHFTYAFSQDQEPTPFCDGVPHSGSDGSSATPDDGGDATPEAGGGEPTAAATPTPSDSSPLPTHEGATAAVPTDCYNSNPPSSGEHLNVQANVEVQDGIILPRIPPDPNVYPDDVFIPREAIPHILEHAGVFVGYNCEDGDQACQDIVEELTDLVNDRIDNHDDRVVMANDPDLPENSIGLSSWTRVLNMPVSEWDKGEVEDFIGTHSCRFDPEGFCG